MGTYIGSKMERERQRKMGRETEREKIERGREIERDQGEEVNEERAI